MLAYVPTACDGLTCGECNRSAECAEDALDGESTDDSTT